MEEKSFFVILLVDFALVVNWQGGQAQLIDDCGGLMEGRGNTIQTPNYPLNYPVIKLALGLLKLNRVTKSCSLLKRLPLKTTLFANTITLL